MRSRRGDTDYNFLNRDNTFCKELEWLSVSLDGVETAALCSVELACLVHFSSLNSGRWDTVSGSILKLILRGRNSTIECLTLLKMHCYLYNK